MAGHSKWANIQHRKGAQDAKRGKIFTRLIREITIATRMAGNGDPASNPRLRLAMDKALSNNMSKDTMERAIKRGLGGDSDSAQEEIRYEGYGPGGVAVMVDCVTDNRNRTAGEVRHAFTKCGGNLGVSGSVAFQFTETGVLSYPEGADEDAITDAAIEAGADDIVVNDDTSIDVLTTPQNYATVYNFMLEKGLEPEESEVTMRAANNVALSLDDAKQMIKMLDMLENLDDTQNVYSNADISSEILSQL
ncbi:YebC/PmpR family DNA-binding transcriptional regulator [Wohlfahrtiimonas chitiniclastica]|uniref:YebC/PmpR family DNA-binding transcriptional regulator n=1 Tax=Wohlfahrtiimonas chitiniclastica TaxID=400946 RepID=UPI000B998D80|nr:YebC/PmpR family DNA-binding transcriptional regulator [Wohlfahrtiimonas chitiniclastica]OYQ77054.1 YebC/PmpR family DNA-binding transcriptional regulator [Wohlfahrtiimonas chitiniclastica]